MKTEMGDQNPWEVKNIETFSFYCCPECDFKSKDGDHFKRHAMEIHNKSKVNISHNLLPIINLTTHTSLSYQPPT